MTQYSEKPRYNEGPRDWQCFVISKFFFVLRRERPKASQREVIIITWAALCISGSWPDVIHRLWKKFLWYRWITSNFFQCKWSGVSNRWKSMIGKPIDQSISIEKKMVSWYRLVSVNRWSIDNLTKTVHRLLSIGTATSNRRHARYLSNHPPFLRSPGDEIGKTIPTQSSQRKEYTPLHVYTYPSSMWGWRKYELP